MAGRCRTGYHQTLEEFCPEAIEPCRRMSERGICHDGREPGVSHEETGGAAVLAPELSRSWWIGRGREWVGR
jgi:hypothetical protein